MKKTKGDKKKRRSIAKKKWARHLRASQKRKEMHIWKKTRRDNIERQNEEFLRFIQAAQAARAEQGTNGYNQASEE